LIGILRAIKTARIHDAKGLGKAGELVMTDPAGIDPRFALMQVVTGRKQFKRQRISQDELRRFDDVQYAVQSSEQQLQRMIFIVIRVEIRAKMTMSQTQSCDAK